MTAAAAPVWRSSARSRVAVDAATAERMVAGVEAAGVVNQVGLVLRFLPSFRWLRHLVHDERAGRMLAVVFRDDQYIPDQGVYGSTWRADADRGGRGTLLEHSIHDVDILLWMLGPVAAVSGAAREVHGLDGIDDVAVARLEFAGGARRHADLGLARRARAAQPAPGRGLLRATARGARGRLHRARALAVHRRAEQVLEGADLARAVTATGDIGTTNAATAFLAAVRDGTPASPALAEALPAHRVVDAVYASAAEGGTVVRPG